MLRSELPVHVLSFFLKNSRTFIMRALRLRNLLNTENYQRSGSITDFSFYITIQSGVPAEGVVCNIFPNFTHNFIPPFIITFGVPASIKEHGSIFLPLRELYKTVIAHERASQQIISIYPRNSERNSLNSPLFLPITLNDVAFPCLLIEAVELIKESQFQWVLEFDYKVFRENYADLSTKFLSCYKSDNKEVTIKVLSAARAALTFNPIKPAASSTTELGKNANDTLGVSTVIPLRQKLNLYSFFQERAEIELKKTLPALPLLDEFVRFSSIYADRIAMQESSPYLGIAFNQKAIAFNIDDFMHFLYLTDPTEFRDFIAAKRHTIE